MREAKIRAAAEGRRLKDVFAEAIRAGLDRRSDPPRERERARITIDSEMGFPLVECPGDAPASRMSADEIRRLVEQSQLQEDLKRAGHSV